MSEFIVRQEEDLIPTGKVVAVWVGGVIITLVGISIAVWLLFAEERTARLHGEGPTPPVAPDQINTLEQTSITLSNRGGHLNAEQREALRHYRWVDRAGGIATIPVERAIDLVVQRGAEKK